jgi:hypothetical protein
VANLSPRKSITVLGEYAFGWWNTTYTTTAWVKAASDTNPFNDFVQRAVITSDRPLKVDFTQLPNGQLVLQPLDLKGDEFSAWNFRIKPDPGTDATCKDAIARIDVQGDTNLLATGLPGQPDKCTSLPVVFTFDPNRSVGGASVGFLARVSGEYKLELFDANGNALQDETADASDNQTLTIQVPPSGDGLSNVQKVVFSGPDGAPILIKSVSFYLVNTSLPTPTP